MRAGLERRPASRYRPDSHLSVEAEAFWPLCQWEEARFPPPWPQHVSWSGADCLWSLQLRRDYDLDTSFLSLIILYLILQAFPSVYRPLLWLYRPQHWWWMCEWLVACKVWWWRQFNNQPTNKQATYISFKTSHALDYSSLCLDVWRFKVCRFVFVLQFFWCYSDVNGQNNGACFDNSE